MEEKLSFSINKQNGNDLILNNENKDFIENKLEQEITYMDNAHFELPNQLENNNGIKNNLIQEINEIKMPSSSSESESSEENEFEEAKSRSRSRSKDKNLNENENEEKNENTNEEKNFYFKNTIITNNNYPKLNETKESKCQFKFPNFSLPLMNYSQFLEFQKNIQIDKELSLKYYAEYQKAYEMMQNKIFFKENKNSFWFLEKYDIKIKEKIYEELKLQSNCLAKRFFYTFNTDGFQGINLTLNDDETSFLEKENKGEIKISNSPFFGFNVDNMSLLIKDIPLCISKFDILNILKSTSGFISIALSEPNINFDFQRETWISFDSSENCQKAKQLLEKSKINGQKLNISSNTIGIHNVKITPPLSLDRNKIDLENTSKLIKILDKEKGINDNELFSGNLNYPLEILLDLKLLYLRRVHFLCYYSCREFEDFRLLNIECGPAYIRSSKVIQAENINLPENYQTKDFQDKLDKFVEERIRSEFQLPHCLSLLKNQILEDFFCENTIKLDEGEYSCGTCFKIFINSDYVKKHIINKHNEQFNEEITFRNYCRDPNRITETQKNLKGKKLVMKNKNIEKPMGQLKSSYPKQTKRYVDFDDPNQRHKNSFKPLVNYDDL